MVAIYLGRPFQSGIQRRGWSLLLLLCASFPEGGVWMYDRIRAYEEYRCKNYSFTQISLLSRNAVSRTSSFIVDDLLNMNVKVFLTIYFRYINSRRKGRPLEALEFSISSVRFKDAFFCFNVKSERFCYSVAFLCVELS